MQRMALRSPAVLSPESCPPPTEILKLQRMHEMLQNFMFVCFYLLFLFFGGMPWTVLR